MKERLIMSSIQHTHTFTTQVTLTVTYQYLLSLPKDYPGEPAKRWPLVLFLHGKGEGGDNLQLLTHQGPPKLVAEGHDFPFLLVSPQCPLSSWWSWETNLHALADLLDEIEDTYQIDPDRI